jgi:release factor glutamine methyltransferase
LSPFITHKHGDLDLQIGQGVYEPAEDSIMLLEAASDIHPKCALEIGTGCGLLSISLWRAGCPFVVATDVSPEATRCAGINVRRYAPGVHLVQCDLFGAIDHSFDLVLFNPPYLAVEKTSCEETYWAGGEKGRELIDRFILELGPYLSKDGRALMLQSSVNDLELSRSMAGERGLEFVVVASSDFFFEKLYVVELTPPEGSSPPARSERRFPL